MKKDIGYEAATVFWVLILTGVVSWLADVIDGKVVTPAVVVRTVDGAIADVFPVKVPR